MKHLFIATATPAYAAKIGGGTISGFNQVNLLVAGAIAFFDPNGVLITTGNASTQLVGQTEYYMAVGGTTISDVGGGSTTIPAAKVSIMIAKTGLFIKTAYAVPVVQVSFVGQNSIGNGSFNFPTYVPGDEAIIKVVFPSPDRLTVNVMEKSRYSYSINGSDTNSTIVAALIAMINSDPDAIVTAAAVGSNVGIQLTAVAFNQSFGIATDGVLANATTYVTGDTAVDGSVSLYPGNGIPADLLKIEDEVSYYSGKSQGIYLPQYFWSVPSLVDITATYDMYINQWTPLRNLYERIQNMTTQVLLLALPSGATQQSTVETILSAAGLM